MSAAPLLRLELAAPRRRLRAIELFGPDEAVLEYADGRRRRVRVHRRRYVSRWLVALATQPPGRSTVLVAAGMLEREAFRRLRVWALWGRVPGVAAEQLPG